MNYRAPTILFAAAAAMLPLVAQTSSHREAPAIARMPATDGTDLYMFMSYEPGREGYVTLLANYLPLQDPFGGPNYFALDPEAKYFINIDNTGDARANIRFLFQFDHRLGGEDGRGLSVDVGDAAVPVPLKNIGPVSAEDESALNFFETYRVSRLGNYGGPVRLGSDGSQTFAKPFDFNGTKTFGSVEGYEEYAQKFVHEVMLPGCDQPGRVFVGQRQESFSANLGKLFDLVNLVPVEAGAVAGLDGIADDPQNNVLADKNITTIALEVHADCLRGEGNGVIGAWTTANTTAPGAAGGGAAGGSAGKAAGGSEVQVSRLGSPLVNEVVIGLPDKDRFNASYPANDARFLKYVTNPTLPALLDALFLDAVNEALDEDVSSLAPSNVPRDDLVAAFLTGFEGVNQLAKVTPSEMLRLNTQVPAAPQGDQDSLGVLAGDLAGFPNGRRPGDDVTDIALRVLMGRLCHPLDINGEETDLGFCEAADAPIGTVPLTDGAPNNAGRFNAEFPYLRTPIAGSADFPNLTSAE